MAGSCQLDELLQSRLHRSRDSFENQIRAGRCQVTVTKSQAFRIGIDPAAYCFSFLLHFRRGVRGRIRFRGGTDCASHKTLHRDFNLLRIDVVIRGLMLCVACCSMRIATCVSCVAAPLFSFLFVLLK